MVQVITPQVKSVPVPTAQLDHPTVSVFAIKTKPPPLILFLSNFIAAKFPEEIVIHAKENELVEIGSTGNDHIPAFFRSAEMLFTPVAVDIPSGNFQKSP
ncbi:MAG: hypothetical protein LBI53_02535 [Candidatus Peribacteria bacterium]|nr:hypothetical protein [Candidatus Peribacteria bacterium]